MEKIYNADIKNNFLAQYEASRESYLHVFKKSYIVEETLEKDLFEFDLKEIGKVFKHIDPLTNKVAKSNGSIVSSYLNWAIIQGYKKDENPLDGKGFNWFEQFVNPFNKIHFTEKEIVEIENKLVNAQDAIVVRMLFEGIQGDKFSEILNIRKHHVDYPNKSIKVTDDKKGERTIEVSDRCIELIKKAFSEDKYWNKNGTAKNEKRLYSVLLENDYLIRSNKTKTENEQRADYNIVYRRLKNIKDETKYEHLTPVAIRQSGMIKMAEKYFKEHGDIPKELLNTIAERFSLNKINNNGYKVYNYRTMKEFINEENINTLYGD